MARLRLPLVAGEVAWLAQAPPRGDTPLTLITTQFFALPLSMNSQQCLGWCLQGCPAEAARVWGSPN